MSQAASKGREGVMPSGAEGTTQARSDVVRGQPACQ